MYETLLVPVLDKISYLHLQSPNTMPLFEIPTTKKQMKKLQHENYGTFYLQMTGN
jgi:hypothetical protein